MSAILDLKDFQFAYPKYSINLTTRYEIPPEKELESGVVFEIIKLLSYRLVRCDRTVLVDNESSKYPYVYEVLSFLLRYADSHFKLRDNTTMPADTDMVIEEFVRNSAEEIANDSPAELLMRWERHFKSLRGPQGTFGFVEFCVELNKMVIKLIEVKQKLGYTNSDVTTCDGFYQACAELARAGVENEVTAEAQCQLNFDMEESKLLEELATKKAKPLGRPSAKEQKERAQMIKKEEARINSAIEQLNINVKEEVEVAKTRAAQQSVHLALTDFTNWIFLELKDKIITVSNFCRPFPPMHGHLAGGPDLITVIQYLASGLGIQPASHSVFMNRSAMIHEDDLRVAKKVVLGVYLADAKLFLNTAATFHIPPDAVKEGFLAKFPEEIWDMIHASGEKA